MQRALLLGCALALSPIAEAQDTRSWLESQGLAAADTKTFQDLDVVIAYPRDGDPKSAEQRLVILKGGKPQWQSTPKETEPGSRWTVHSVGRDLDGDGQPDLHASTFSGGRQQACCTTHHVMRLKPQVKRLAGYSAGNVGGGEFIDVPGRKAPVMISADDSDTPAGPMPRASELSVGRRTL